MGSRDEFVQMLEFVNRHLITPIISRVLDKNGLDGFEEAVQLMRDQTQFGKIVLRISSPANHGGGDQTLPTAKI